MKFNKIVCVDETKIDQDTIHKLQDYCEQDVEVHHDFPDSEEEIIKRIGDAEAVIVSWKTQLTKTVIDACPNLKYIGMACSLYDDESANVAVDHARQKGITVTGILDYGDPGVAEFIISELIQLLNGYKGLQFQEEPRELTGLKIGIVGLGVTGKLLADCLLPFGAEVFYFSRSRKADYEAKGVKYLELNELLATCEVFSFHLPKNTELLNTEHFDLISKPTILINTSLGLPFDVDAFGHWIKSGNNYAIFDGDGKKELPQEMEKLSNVIAMEKSAGWSAQTRVRLSQKVLQNLAEYCDSN